jgi:glyoxylase-like metal-dependent hydrolase (beta-lactamase superfamily II)
MGSAFNIKKIADSIWRINEPFFKEGANMYLFSGNDRQLLVDAGVGAANVYAFLAEQGFKNVYTVITHAHFDHCGGLIHAAPSKVFVTLEQAVALQNPGDWGLHYMNKKDFDAKILENIAGCTVDSFLDDFKRIRHGEYHVGIPKKILSFGQFDFQFLDAPGHTSDSVIFYDCHKGMAVTGDALYAGKVYIDFPNANVQDFQDTLANMDKLSLRVVLPGHNSELSASRLGLTIRRFKKELKQRAKAF